MFPSPGKTSELPLSEAVRVALHPGRAGRIGFAGGMDMIQAQVGVQ